MAEVIFRPTVCVPDKDPSRITANELIDALDVRIGITSPIGGPAVYKVLGNFLLTNPYLPAGDIPAGDNKAVGWCADRVSKTLYWFNYNPDELDILFQYNEDTGFQKVLEMDLGLTANTLLSMDYGNGYVVWTSIDIKEPRQINVAKALAGQYQTPIPAWETYMLHRVPATPLEVSAYVATQAGTVPKPVDDVVNVGYQFCYNYEFITSIEGRRSQPTGVFWNNVLTLTIPASEVAFLNDGTPNPYIVAIRFYYRVGNTGDWVYLQRLLNEGTYSILILSLQSLSSIGTPSVAALLDADGIPVYADDVMFGDNRTVLGNQRTGYNVTLPTATTTIVNNDYDFDARGWQQFAPVKQTIDLALVFMDAQGRDIGTTTLAPVTLWSSGNAGWQVDLKDVYTTGGGGAFDLDGLVWDQAVDYLWANGGGGSQPSQWDLRFGIPKIRITPTNTIALPAVAESAMLLTRSHRAFNSYLRTQARPYFIYKKGVSQEFTIWLASNLGESFTADGAEYTFYGLGFQFASGEPINFSTEQNLNIQIIGSLFTTSSSVPTPNVDTAILAPNTGEYKVTDIQGNILIVKYAWANLTSDVKLKTFSLVDLSGFTPTTGTDRYGHEILDVMLYAKNTTPVTTWNRVPSVLWTKAEWTALMAKDYYGDSYSCGDEKNMTTPGINVQSSWFNGTYYPNNISLPWQGYWSSMNLNGLYQEDWSSDIGSAAALFEPKEVVLGSAINHSESFIENTEINNMFAFNPLNRTFTQSQLGSITKLITLAVNNSLGNNLYAVCKAGVEMIFLGKTQQTGTDGNSVLSVSTKVFGSQNVLRINYGAQKKNQVVMTNVGVAWMFDEINNALVQISNNGLDPVSSQRDFQSQTNTIGNNGNIGFDPLYSEVVVQQGGDGLSYNFERDLYQGRRFYGGQGPELFMWLSDSDQYLKMYGLYEGQLYIFNQGDLMLDDVFDCELTFVLNQNMDMTKRLAAMEILSPNQTAFAVDIATQEGLETDITEAEFELREGMYYGAIRCATNTTGGKYDGADMHTYIAQVKLKSQENDQKTITFAKVIYTESPTNQR